MNTNTQGTHKQGEHGDGSFIAGSVRIVDYDKTNNNVLVRGSSAFGAVVATTGKDFVINDLINAIKNDLNYSSLKSAGIKLQRNPFVVDFCLIGFRPSHKKGHPHKDDRIVTAEMNWFTDSPPTLNGESGPYPVYIPSTIKANRGIMVYWPIQAISGPPLSLPTKVGDTWPVSPENSIGTNSNGTGFDFSGLIPAIWSTLTNSVSLIQATPPLNAIKNAIIYVHCDSGVNRTGAAVTGYLMTHGSNLSALGLNPQPASPYTLAQAQAAANSAPPSNDTVPPGGSDIWVTEAYCNYLNTGHYDAALVAASVPNPVPAS